MQTAIFPIHLQVIHGFAPGGSTDFYFSSYNEPHSAAGHFMQFSVRYGDVQKGGMGGAFIDICHCKPFENLFFFSPKTDYG